MERRTVIAKMLAWSLMCSMFSFTVIDIYAVGKPANSKQQIINKQRAASKQQTANQKQVTVVKSAAMQTLKDLKSIPLTAKSSVKLMAVNMYEQNGSNIVTWTLRYENNEQQDIPLISYWPQIRTGKGTIYTSYLLAKDKDKKVVSKHSNKVVTYCAKVAQDVKLHNLFIDIIKWDFSKPNSKDIRGSFHIPHTMVTATLAGESSTVHMSNIPIKTTIDRAILLPSGNTSHLSVTVNVENIGRKTVEASKYKYVLKTESGRTYPLVPSIENYKLQPDEKKTLRFMATAPKALSLGGKMNKLEMQILEENEVLKVKDEVEKMDLPIATFKLPNLNQDNLIIPAYKNKELTINDSKINTRIVASRINQGFDQNEIMLEFEVENLARKPVKIPKYELELNGPDETVVPIDTKAFDDLTLQPQEKRLILLLAKVKASIATSGLKLQLNHPADVEQKDQKEQTETQYKKVKYPEVLYALPELQSMSDQMGVEYDIQHNKGNFSITLVSIQRLPGTNNEDIVSAKIKIKNKENRAIQSPLSPLLIGFYKFDEVDHTRKTRVITSSEASIIGAREEEIVYIVTNISKYTKFSHVQVALMEQGKGEKDVPLPLIQLTNSGKFSEISVVEHGSPYKLENQSYKVNINALDSKVYSGKGEQIIYTNLVMQSQEGRQTASPQMVGYYRTEDGREYKAEIVQAQGPTNAHERNVLTAWTKIPSSIDAKGLKLILGEGIKENVLTPPKGESAGKGEAGGKVESSGKGEFDGYVNAVAMSLNVVQPSFKTDPKNMNLFPYVLSINEFYVNTNKGSNLNIELKYDLTRQEGYRVGEEYDHKLIIEIRDADGQTVEKVLEIGTDKGLEEEKGKSFSTSVADSSSKDVINSAFQVTFYDSFKGHKIKLASFGSVYNIKNRSIDD